MASRIDEQNLHIRRSMGISGTLSQDEHKEINTRYPGLTREHCFLCSAETGLAGRGEDSLYNDKNQGPYCKECWAFNAGREIAQ